MTYWQRDLTVCLMLMSCSLGLLIISDKEEIEKVGDVGKEVGREALGNVYNDKVDVIVNILYLENSKLVIELGIYEFLFTFLPKSVPNQRHIEYIF